MARSLVALVLAGILVACNRSSGDSESLLPPEPSPTTTIDVSKVPPTIDVPYVQAVMNALDQKTGDMVRILVANKLPNAEFFALLQAIYDEPQFSHEQADYGRYAARCLEPLNPNPGNPTTLVQRIVDSSSNCIVAQSITTMDPSSRHRRQRTTAVGLFSFVLRRANVTWKTRTPLLGRL